MHFAGKSYTLSLQNKKEGAGMAKLVGNESYFNPSNVFATFSAYRFLIGSSMMMRVMMPKGNITLLQFICITTKGYLIFSRLSGCH